MTLVDQIAERLDAAGVRFALIGAGALAVHGVSRSTVDHDLLVSDPGVLALEFWRSLGPGVTLDSRIGSADDPLGGMVGFTRAGDRDVDVVVGRDPWMDAILHRIIRVPLPGRDLPVVSMSDLILLKLYAGGLQDRWDIAQLLATDPPASVREDVESRLTLLPHDCAALWQRLGS